MCFFLSFCLLKLLDSLFRSFCLSFLFFSFVSVCLPLVCLSVCLSLSLSLSFSPFLGAITCSQRKGFPTPKRPSLPWQITVTRNHKISPHVTLDDVANQRRTICSPFAVRAAPSERRRRSGPRRRWRRGHPARRWPAQCAGSAGWAPLAIALPVQGESWLLGWLGWLRLGSVISRNVPVLRKTAPPPNNKASKEAMRVSLLDSWLKVRGNSRTTRRKHTHTHKGSPECGSSRCPTRGGFGDLHRGQEQILVLRHPEQQLGSKCMAHEETVIFKVAPNRNVGYLAPIPVTE